MRSLINEMERKYGFPQAFGCVDGTHIAISQPLENSHDYLCYKMKYSLNVQGICDHTVVFMNVDIRWPGSVNDAKVFANSNVNHALRENLLPQGYRQLLPGTEKVPLIILGDPAYPLLPYCMKEFASTHNNGQVVFNNLLRSARNTIERAFGRLKMRWQILDKKKLENVPEMVYACFVLHNFCELNDVSCDNEPQSPDEVHAHGDNDPDQIFAVNTAEGEHVRDTICEYINEHAYPDL